MTARYHGLTWDHPRGYAALAASGGELIHWDKHPLEGFESRPIAEQCALYDLVVLSVIVQAARYRGPARTLEEDNHGSQN